MARVLIWNRGEIALRIAVAARRVGATSIAALPPSELESRVVEWADELVELPDAEAAGTYNDLALLDATVRATGATHVHPGYGFLSESPRLAVAVRAAGASLVGPDEHVLAEMASKSASKAFAREAGLRDLGVPARFEAGRVLLDEEVPYPLLLKADAGGGGRGNRVVRDASALDETAADLRAFSATAFGDDRLLVERYLGRARHVELQVFGVPGRGVRVLDSRDCSLQRHHQKVLEEGPAPNRVLASLGAHLRGIERALSRRGYRGAGTIELLYDEATAGVFFLEMNPRIQVEHPVTEWRLGIDLVEWQLREALGLDPGSLFDELDAPRGHVVEVRLYAEDPARDFLPDAGRVHLLDLPRLPFARFDTALVEGGAVSSSFDPMFAKLVVHGATREEAFVHLAMALDHTHVHGVRTNLSLLRAIAGEPDVLADVHDMGWLERVLPRLLASDTPALDPSVLPREPSRGLDLAAGRTAGRRWKDAHRS